MKPRRSFVLALVVAVVAGGGYVLGRVSTPPPLPPRPAATVSEESALTRTLRLRYGPDRNSEELEEWIIRDFFNDERDGVFLDVGANHHQIRNNTYYLETTLGWSGVAIEPQTQFAEGYQKFRPRTIFIPMFVSGASEQDATLWVPIRGNHRIASYDRTFTESAGIAAEPLKVRTITLDDILDRLRISRIDFMSMDIELAEPQALAGLSIKRFAPRLIGIEAHNGVQQQILEYFGRNGYVLIGKYLSVDHDNFWFAPVGIVKDHR